MSLFRHIAVSSLKSTRVSLFDLSLLFQNTAPGVARQCLMVDLISPGMFALYDRLDSPSFYMSSAEHCSSITEGQQVLTPTFEISTQCTINPDLARDSLLEQEDSKFFCMLDCVTGQGNRTLSYSGQITSSAINQSFEMVEQHDLTVGRVVTHPITWLEMREVCGQHTEDNYPCDPFSAIRSALRSSGTLFCSDVFLSSKVPVGDVFCFAPAEYVGALPIRQDFVVLPTEGRFLVYEEIGMVMLNIYSISRLHAQ